MEYFEKPHGYVYRIINKIDGRTYIGQRMLKYDKTWRSYLGSGTLIIRDVKELGAENFIKQLITYCNSMEELDEVERNYIIAERSNGKAEYNLTLSTLCGYKYISHEDRKKLKVRLVEAKKEEYRKIFSDLNDEIITSYNDSRRIKDVSKQFGLPKARIRNFLIESGIELNSQLKVGRNLSEKQIDSIKNGANAFSASLCQKRSCKNKSLINEAFCSSDCETKAKNACEILSNNLFAGFLFTCVYCSKVFKTIKSNQKYCSNTCVQKSRADALGLDKIDDAIITESKILYSEGYSLRYISEKLNVDRKKLSPLLKADNVDIRFKNQAL